MTDKSTLTFLFTDIEGSTRLWEQQPEAMQAALLEQDRILREAIDNNSGRIFRTVGDAYCAVFNTAPAALRAAVESQQALIKEPWELDLPLRVRIVLHTGEAEASRGDFIGASLNRLGRMLDVCYGGQVLLSLATEELVRDRLPPGVSLLELGQHRFRDLVHPERIFQVLAPGLPDQFPPLASLDAIPNNLPIQLTPFIGRQAELVETLHLISETRLLTLTGPGGTGKTRMAIQTAAEALNSSYPDGAWLVELASISNPERILPAIAGVLNVPEPVGRSLEAALMDFLRSKKLLLILDNCEHMIEACANVAVEILKAGMEVKVLTSSREPLGIAGEWIFRVPSFTLPAAASSLDELMRNEAIQLFVERARAVKPGFSLTSQNAPAVIQICHRLDGIPLAIELAAARVVLFSPLDIANRLDNRFRLLSGGSRAAVPRQQTLEATIGWSYELLSPEEKRLFHSLSVFPSDFSYEAAEAVFGNEILELLTQLVNKSLVLVEEDLQEGGTRYRLLETIRQYALGKLLASGEMESVRDRHVEFFHHFSSTVTKEIGENQLRRLVNLLLKERENLQSAIAWGLERMPITALSIVGQHPLFWAGQHGFAAQALNWLEEGLKRSSALPTQDDQEGINLKAIIAQAYYSKAVAHGALGDISASIQDLERSVPLWRQVGDLHGLSRSLSLLGFRGTFQALPNAYRACAEEGLAIARQIHETEAIGTSLSALGREKIWEGNDYATAQAYIEEALMEIRKTGNERMVNIAQMTLGQIALLQRDYSSARTLFTGSMAVFQGIGDFFFANASRSGLAETARLEGNFSQAVKIYLETLSEWQELGNQGAISRCLECLAFIAADLYQTETHPTQKIELLRRTGILLGAASALRESSGSNMVPDERREYDERITDLQADASGEVLKGGWQSGRALSIEQVKVYGEGLLNFIK